MDHLDLVKKTFDNWVINKNGALKMSTEHWPRVEEVLTTVPPSDGNYLEIGPGNGYAIKYMAENKFSAGQCYGIELSQEMANCCIAKTRGLRNVSIEQTDFNNWAPSPSVSFNLIFSMEVFYYFQDMKGAINKAAHLLADDGELVVMVDFFMENPSSHSWPDDLGYSLTLWSQAQYAEAFRDAGLSNIRQILISGGDKEDGLTLCTRGKK